MIAIDSYIMVLIIVLIILDGLRDKLKGRASLK